MRRLDFVCKSCLKHLLISFMLWCGSCYFAVAQGRYYSWDFSECEIKDILYAVSLDTGISIVADDTVSGKGDLKFAGNDFSVAFEAFLNGNRLFVQRKEDVWIVSRYSLVREGELFYFDACDMQPNQILEKLSYGVDKALTFDSLPNQKMSVHFRGLKEADLMESLGKRFGNYEVSSDEVGYHFGKKVESRKVEVSEGFVKLEKWGDGFSVDVRDGKFSEIMEKLFGFEDSEGNCRSFCLLANGDVKVQRSVFNGLDFTDTLTKLCAQSGFSFVCDKDLFYIFANGNSKNELISGNRVWKKFTLRFTKAQEFFSCLGKRVGKLETLALPDESSFLCCASEAETELINELIENVDIKTEIYEIKLNYIKPTDLMAHLPPGVDKNSLFLADDDSVLFFKGTESSYLNLKNQINLCDKPVKRLSYDLLILQYDNSTQNNWSAGLSAGKVKAGDRTSAGAMLGSVMNFNLNVVTAFGFNFAAEMQTSIEENKTKVYADTTLHGVSGKTINFQNTNTFRYRDNNVDPDTGLPIYSGVTKEIASGIKLEITGWVSGNGMITSRVTASVSRQGTDTSSSTGNPPPTSEKIVTTEVCGKSGEPVILSGLIQSSESDQQKRTPLLSKIPLLGNLFKSSEKNKEQTQMVIYLVPHIEGEKKADNVQLYDEVWAKKRIEKLNQIMGA